MTSKFLEELSYWIGIVQSDGSFSKYLEGKKERYRVSMGVGPKSINMLRRFVNSSQKLFWRKTKIWKMNDRDSYIAHISVNSILHVFENFSIKFGDPPTPPAWMKTNISFFGPYLAGVIDGDGDIRIRRPKYPQLAIRITSGKHPGVLTDSIRSILNCGVSISRQERYSVLQGRHIHGKCHVLEFVVSHKNIELFKKFVLPHILIPHKKSRIEQFMNSNLN